MAFLFQDQNQGTRQDDTPREDAREIATVLFHPDFNRRLRLRTESADPLSPEIVESKGARGLGRCEGPYRRWGISPRPENIKPPGMGGPLNYAGLGRAPQAALVPKSACRTGPARGAVRRVLPGPTAMTPGPDDRPRAPRAKSGPEIMSLPAPIGHRCRCRRPPRGITTIGSRDIT